MESAKSFVAKHTSRTGHFTDVEEIVQPAVTWEQVKPTRHEIVTEAVDREVHKHHYHTTVQPLSHSVSLPVQHKHNLLPAKHSVFQKDDVESTKQRLATEAAQFKNVSITLPTTHSSAHLPPVIGTRYHHHIHEFVQPILYKETIQKEFVHTTIPIHEVHHSVAKHHTMSQLPATTLAEFESLKISKRSAKSYEGPPRAYDSKLETSFEKLGLGLKNLAMPTTSQDRKSLTIGGGAKTTSGLSRSSSSSASSVSSLDHPTTPRSPSRGYHSLKHEVSPAAFNANPATKANLAQPVRIVDPESPRFSNDSTASGRRGFLDKLTGRA